MFRTITDPSSTYSTVCSVLPNRHTHIDLHYGYAFDRGFYFDLQEQYAYCIMIFFQMCVTQRTTGDFRGDLLTLTAVLFSPSIPFPLSIDLSHSPAFISSLDPLF